jgi:hypothetical protein
MVCTVCVRSWNRDTELDSPRLRFWIVEWRERTTVRCCIVLIYDVPYRIPVIQQYYGRSIIN